MAKWNVDFRFLHLTIVTRSVTFRSSRSINQTESLTAGERMNILEREPDERTLIEAAQNQPARFAELYEQNFDRIYAFFARRVSTREEAQDLTAEVFHQALTSIRSFRWQGAPFISWLYGIAAHVLSKYWRRLGSDVPLEEMDLAGSRDEIEQSVLLGQLVDGLPRDQRTVLIRRFVDQKSIREIAQELGRSEGAVKQLQLRGLENLRDKLGRKQ